MPNIAMQKRPWIILISIVIAVPRKNTNWFCRKLPYIHRIISFLLNLIVFPELDWNGLASICIKYFLITFFRAINIIEGHFCTVCSRFLKVFFLFFNPLICYLPLVLIHLHSHLCHEFSTSTLDLALTAIGADISDPRFY